MPSSPTPVPGSDFGALLDQVARYVESEIDSGRTQVELAAEVLAELRAPPITRRPPAQAPAASPPTRAAAVPPPPATPAVRPVRAAAAASAPKAASPETEKALGRIAATVASCVKCVLHQQRTRTVPGQGASRPEVMFIGEGPGAEEDIQGLAFVGAAGQLLTKMIEAMGYRREDVFIGNIVKCRPPNNRPPTPDEMAACMPYLLEQIALLAPTVIVALGATAVKGLGLLPEGIGISKVRGQWRTFHDIPVMPTFHPAYLLRNPAAKREVWEDLKAVLSRLGRPVPPTGQKKG